MSTTRSPATAARSPPAAAPTSGSPGWRSAGLGFLGRLHGMTADALLAARVVLADGSAVEASERSEPDLFWALRGSGGGQFGVATSLALETLPAPSVATSLHLAAAPVRPGAAGGLAGVVARCARRDGGQPAAHRPVGSARGRSRPTSSAPWLADSRARPRALLGRARGRASAPGPLSSALVEAALPRDEAPAGRARPRRGRCPAGISYCKSEFFRRARSPATRSTALIELLAADRRAGESRELDFSALGRRLQPRRGRTPPPSRTATRASC